MVTAVWTSRLRDSIPRLGDFAVKVEMLLGSLLGIGFDSQTVGSEGVDDAGTGLLVTGGLLIESL